MLKCKDMLFYSLCFCLVLPRLPTWPNSKLRGVESLSWKKKVLVMLKGSFKHVLLCCAQQCVFQLTCYKLTEVPPIIKCLLVTRLVLHHLKSLFSV